MTKITHIDEHDLREPDRICMDCGKLFLLALATLSHIEEDPDLEKEVLCPRCGSAKHIEYDKADHQEIEIKVPEGWEHPMEAKARELFDRVSKLTGWREVKVRHWFQQGNPLLGNVSPEWMLMNDNAKRLEKFIAEAEESSAEYGTC